MTTHRAKELFSQITGLRLVVLFAVIASLFISFGFYSRDASAAPWLPGLDWISTYIFDDNLVRPVSDDPQTALGDPPKSVDSSLLLSGNGFVEAKLDQGNITRAFTIETWIKPAGADTPQGLIQVEGSTSSISLSISTERKLEFKIGTAPELQAVESLQSISLNEWHHVAVMFDSGSVSLFVDGVLSSTNDVSLKEIDLSGAVRIGAVVEGREKHNFNGLIDEVRIANFLNPQRNGHSNKNSIGSAITGSYLGVWRFAEQFKSTAGNPSEEKIVGSAWYSPEVSNISDDDTSELVDYCGTTPVTNSICRRFDELVPYYIVGNHYPGVSFQGTGQYVYITDNFSDDGGGSSLPNKLAGWDYYNNGSNFFVPLSVSFTNPVNNLSFRVTGLDEYGVYYAIVKITQENGTISYRALRNFGYSVPVDYYFGLASCDNGPCTNITSILIYQITDPKGIVFDNFSYTPSGDPTPTATPVTPTPTATPPHTSVPTSFSATEEVGQVRLTWLPGESGADLFEVWRTTSNGDELLDTIQGNAPLEYIDRDVKIRHNYSYKIIARLNGNPSAPTAPKTAAPRSPCDELPIVVPPDIGLPDVQFSAYGWTGRYSKGHSVAWVKLNGRNFGHMIAAHYVKVKTNKMQAPQHIVLVAREQDNPAGNQGFLARTFGYSTKVTADGLSLKSDYCVSSPSGQAQWIFTVNYVFSKTVPADRCEPSSWLPCNRFYPLVSYEYESPTEFGETHEMVQVAQRLRFREGTASDSNVSDPPNTIGLFQDCEYPWALNQNEQALDYRCIPAAFPISGGPNPVRKEIYAKVISNGQAAFSYDNFHQTHNPMVDPPSTFPLVPAGCFSCVHDHWRWTKWASYLPSIPPPFRLGDEILFRQGLPMIGWKYYQPVPMAQYSVPWQDVEIGIVRVNSFDPWPPTNFRDLINGEPLGTSFLDPRGYNDIFYVATSREPNIGTDGKNRAKDLVHAHGGFFNPSYTGDVSPIVNSSKGKAAKIEKTEVLVDGPVSVTYEHVFEAGETTFSQFAANGTALPVGYTALNNVGYIVGTTASVSGTHTFTLKAESVSDPAIFAKLRILHAEFDEFDPHVPKWVDRTILSPDPQGPDFPTRTIKAAADSVGKFIIAVRDPSVPVPTTNLKVEASDSPDPVRSDNNLTYSLNARNISAQGASSVVLMHVLPPSVRFVSATPSQGTCRLGADDLQLHELPDFANRVYCQLGSLGANGIVPVTIVVTPTEGEDTYPPEGKLFSSYSAVRAAETDTDLADNAVGLDTTVLPSLNAKPTVQITSPGTDAVFVSPYQSQINIPITISASDTDGTITHVSVFDGETLIGNAALISENQYQITLPTPSYGYHNIYARAFDNGGRSATASGLSILVNGLSTFSVSKPTETLFTPGSSILLETTSGVASSRIQKVEIYTGGSLIGRLRQAAATGGLNKHQFTWTNVVSGKHQLVAILTEYSGATTTVHGPMLTVTNPPEITVSSPTNGSSYQQVTSLPINAQVSDADGYVEKVDFYLNGVLKKTNTGNVSSGASSFEWLNPPDGVYSLVVVATDNLGVESASQPISFGINRPAPAAGELIWVDDEVPTGATTGGNDGWHWRNLIPTALLGNAAHQSLLLNGQHEHYFENASQRLSVLSGEHLSAWVFLDPDFPPAEIMLQFHDGQGWEHRAYWGDNLIDVGVNGTPSRMRIGDLPTGTGWKQLIIPASSVGLVGKQVSGMKFTLFNGRAAWDRVGKLASTWNPPTPSGDFLWVEDEPPPGAILEWIHDTWTDGTWITSNPSPYSGTKAHRHWQNDFNEPFRQHSFRNPINSMMVDPGDTLTTYVYLYPDAQYRPDSLLLQWYDDASGWSHRAYWGRDFRRNIVGFDGIPAATEAWRYMGPVPASGGWVRLEIPASYVGLEGKLVKGMAFAVYQNNKRGRAVWDFSGKTSAPPQNPSVIPALKFTSPLYRFSCGTGSDQRLRYYQNVDFNYPNVHNCTGGVNIGYTYAAQIPGTVPLFALENTQWRRWRLYLCANCEEQYGYYAQYIAAFVPTSQLPDSVRHTRYICNNGNDHYTTSPFQPDPWAPACPTGWAPEYYVHTR